MTFLQRENIDMWNNKANGELYHTNNPEPVLLQTNSLMENTDTLWVQRFSNFKKALAKLEEVATRKDVGDLSDLEKEGMIQRFEYTFELAWKTLQDLLEYKGYRDIAGPNPVLAQALKDGYINDEKLW